jgi:hypothetical protein
MDVGVVSLGLTLNVLTTWGRDDAALVSVPTYY